MDDDAEAYAKIDAKPKPKIIRSPQDLQRRVYKYVLEYEYLKECVKLGIAFVSGGGIAVVGFWLFPPTDRRAAITQEMTALIESKWAPSDRALKLEPVFVSSSEDRLDGTKATAAAGGYTLTKPGTSTFEAQGLFVGLFNEAPTSLLKFFFTRDKTYQKLSYAWHLKGIDPDSSNKNMLALLPTARFLSSPGGLDSYFVVLVWMDKVERWLTGAPLLLARSDTGWRQVICTSADQRSTTPQAFKRTSRTASYADEQNQQIRLTIVEDNTNFAIRQTEVGWDILEMSEFIGGAAIYNSMIVWSYNLGYCKQHANWNGGYQLIVDRNKLGPTRQASMETLYQRGLNRREPESKTFTPAPQAPPPLTRK